MNENQITDGARAIVDSITIAAQRRGISDTETFAMASIAFVEIIGAARGPHGMVEFLRDLADQIEADNRRTIG